MFSFLKHYIKCCIDFAPVAKNINSASTFLKSTFLVSQPFVNLFSGRFAINLDKCLFILLCSSFISARILWIFFYLCCRHFYLIDNDYYKVYFIFTMILLINSSIFVKRPLWEKKSCCKLPNGHEPMQWHQKQTSPITFIYIEYIYIFKKIYIFIF